MSFKVFIIPLFLCSFLCTQCQNKKILVGTEVCYLPYDFNHHDGKFEMPKELNEISGIAFLSKDKILAVQDEEPDVFIFDLEEEEIIQQIDFGKDGDYEGLCLVDKKVAVIRSDGKLFEFELEEDEEDAKDVVETKIKGFDSGSIEGICYDFVANHYLLAFKGQTNNDQGDERSIYILKDGELSNKPYLTIGNEALKHYFKKYKVENEDIIEMANNLVLLKPSFYPSAIEIHPITKDIYLLSSVRELLMVIDAKSKEIKCLVKLYNDLMPQPEGLAFEPDGTLYISSERADGEDAVIVKFNMKK